MLNTPLAYLLNTPLAYLLNTPLPRWWKVAVRVAWSGAQRAEPRLA